MLNVLAFVFLISNCLQLVTNVESVSPGTDSHTDRVLKVYIYNVTNSHDFLTKGSKAVINELGPYVYVRTWQEGNDQGKFGEEKFYKFNETLSNGRESDMVVVPNIPIFMSMTETLNNFDDVGSTLSAFLKMLQEEPFVNITAQQFIWGYESHLLTFVGNFAQRPGDPIIHVKNFDGVIGLLRSRFIDFTRYGLVDHSQSEKQSSEGCNRSISLDGSDFSGNLNKESVIYAHNENFCRLIPLSYEKSVSENYRFSANKDVFSVKLPSNPCYCPGGPPCPTSTPTDPAQCGYVSLFPLAFPHFYLSDDSYRTAVEGISQADPEKHKFYIDVQPTTGVAVNVKARYQLNIAVPQVKGITEGATFPKITFPLMWFEEGSY